MRLRKRECQDPTVPMLVPRRVVVLHQIDKDDQGLVTRLNEPYYSFEDALVHRRQVISVRGWYKACVVLV
jgi:hypothetical protein